MKLTRKKREAIINTGNAKFNSAFRRLPNLEGLPGCDCSSNFFKQIMLWEAKKSKNVKRRSEDHAMKCNLLAVYAVCVISLCV